jgi:phenylpropionate dioxygenase-like ring-hydroxylating dioxygenase large terminal subunit
MDAIEPGRNIEGLPADTASFHQSWYPAALSRELASGAVIGVDFLGTRVAVYRDTAGKPVVQSAWCPHMGAGLSVGQIVDGQIRCAYHHWHFDDKGRCAHIPTGDKIPARARIFTYPTAEAWGLVWAFNGEKPLFDVPRIPGVEQHELALETRFRGIRQVQPWVSASNGVDFQHLPTLHNLPARAPEDIDVADHSIEYRIEAGHFVQHGRITGTNVFAQRLRREQMDTFMLFAGAPTDQHRARSFFAIGVRHEGDGAARQRAVAAKLEALRGFVERLLAEDEPVLNTMRFKRGVMVASDRHLSRYFKYVDEFPRYRPSAV